MEVDIWLVCQPCIPVRRSYIISNNSLLGCIRSDLKRKRLTSKSCKSLIRSPPVVAHTNPSGSASLNPHTGNVSTTSNIHHIHQQPVGISLELEPKPTAPNARHAAVEDGDDADLPLRNLLKSRLRHVEMGTRRVAPPTVVRVLRPVWWAKVCGCNCCERHIFITCSRLVTFYLVTSPTSISIIEQCRAQSSGVCSVAIVEQVSVPTSSPCIII